MSFLTRSRGILGMNARNLLYVSRHNSKADKRFADDKIYTKNFLASRGIGVARIFLIIKKYKELRALTHVQLPDKFVIKPNHGFAGEGILVIRERQKEKFIDAAGRALTWDDLFKNMIAILEGKYAISGLRDTVIIEELLEPHECFHPFVEYGLPDIRIIVFNFVPVIAMLRLPSRESHGKANLHLGALGLGLDLKTGNATYGVHHNAFITRLPNGKRVTELSLPEWKSILLTASLCQKISGIGYLAVDVALTSRGIKVLELNARAGLSVQIANRVFLKSRLEKIADLKVGSPEIGVEIAQTLFAQHAASHEQKKRDDRIIGPFEQIRVLGAIPEICTAKIDLHAEVTLIDETIKLGSEEKILNIYLNDKRLKMPFEKTTFAPAVPYRMILAGKYLRGFLVDPTQQHTRTKPLAHNQDKMIANLDQSLARIVGHINLLSHIRPQNIESQREFFLEHPTSSPHFSYRPLTLDLNRIRRKLLSFQRDIKHSLMPLYEAKINEVEKQLTLLESRGSKEFPNNATNLFGTVSEYEYQQALEFLSATNPSIDESDLLTVKQVHAKIEAFLKKRHISGWHIIIAPEAIADMHVNKKGVIVIRKKALITEYRLRGLLAHEIETHVYRRENGRAQKYRIFENGTAGYLETEEGLAIFNQEQLGLPAGSKNIRFAWYILAIYHGTRVGFADLYEMLTVHFHIPPRDAVLLCIKVKRGLTDTNQPGVFTKDRLYFSGYTKIKKYLEEKGEEGIKNLYVGKIGIQDLSHLRHVECRPPRLLPSWLEK